MRILTYIAILVMLPFLPESLPVILLAAGWLWASAK